MSTCEMEAQEHNTSPLSLYYQMYSAASAPLITGHADRERERIWVRQENQKLLWFISHYHLGDQVLKYGVEKWKWKSSLTVKDEGKVKLHIFILFAEHYTIYAKIYF